MSEWKENKLGDICNKVTSGGTPNTRKNEYYGGEIPWVRTQEVNFNRIYDAEIKISEAGLANSSAKWIPENSVIIAMYGATAGKVAINKIPVTTNQACCNLIIDKEKADYRFIYYNILSRFSTIANMAVGGAQQNLNAGMIKDLPVFLPDLPTQSEIAEILSSLDDKIELNNKINQELETLAKALFNLICEVNDAQDNDGWSTIKLKDILSIKNGYAFKGMDFIESGKPVIKIKNVKAGKINFNNLSYVSENIANKAEKFKIKKYDLLITMSGNRIDGSMDTWVGKVGMFPKEGEYLLNQRVSILNLDNIKLKYYLLQLLSSEEYQYHFISNATSSGGQANISPDLIYNTEILLPPADKIDVFDNVASDIYSIIFNNMSENESLIESREILLPKLISGELVINETNN